MDDLHQVDGQMSVLQNSIDERDAAIAGRDSELALRNFQLAGLDNLLWVRPATSEFKPAT